MIPSNYPANVPAKCQVSPRPQVIKVKVTPHWVSLNLTLLFLNAVLTSGRWLAAFNIFLLINYLLGALSWLSMLLASANAFGGFALSPANWYLRYVREPMGRRKWKSSMEMVRFTGVCATVWFPWDDPSSPGCVHPILAFFLPFTNVILAC